MARNPIIDGKRLNDAEAAAFNKKVKGAKAPIVSEGEAAKVNAGKAASFAQSRDAAAANAGEAQRVAAMRSANPPPAAATPRLGPPSGSPAASNSLVPSGRSAPPNQLAIRPSGPLAPNSPRFSGPSPSRFGKVGANVGNMALAAGANYAKRKIEEQDPSSIMGQAAQGVGLVGTGAVEGAALGRQFAGGLGAGVGAVVGGINAPVQYLLGKEGDRRVENIQHEGRRKEIAGHLVRAADPLNAEDRRRRQADARQDYLESQPKYYDPNSGLSQDGLPSGRYLNAPDLSSLQGPAGQAGQSPAGQSPAGQSPEGQAPEEQTTQAPLPQAPPPFPTTELQGHRAGQAGKAPLPLGNGSMDDVLNNALQQPTPAGQAPAGQAPARQAPARQAPARQAPAASAQGQSDQFRRYHGTVFDPNSRLDRQKMEAMRSAGVQMDKSGMGPQAKATRKTLTAADMYDKPNPNAKFAKAGR